MIRTTGLGYRYPDAARDAIEGVEFAAGSGDLVVVAGASGSGKSTFLRALNGLVPHFHGGVLSGEVSVDGHSTAGRRPRDLAALVGFVGQDPESAAAAPHVEDDIVFVLENLGHSPASMRKRLEEVLDALGLARLRDRRLETLSGGERQRVAIAGAMAALPGHLVLDEPTSQLDPQSAEEVIAALLRLRDEAGTAIVLAEHRLERVLQYAERVCVFEDGACDFGAPRDVLVRHDTGPPVTRLGRALGWETPALTLREARERVAALAWSVPVRSPAPQPGARLAACAGLSLSLGGRRVLRGVDFEAGEGEVVALMGRNGSGKTTLLRALAGLVPPGKGSVWAASPRAFVPQNPSAILFRRSVLAEIGATLKARRGRGAQAALEARRLGVEDLLDANPADLSGGQRTRAAMAAALAGDPPLVLLDEPTRGLDEPGKARLLALVRSASSRGRAVVMATHDVELAARAATRVVLLAEGEVVLDAPPREALAGSLVFSTQMTKVFGDPAVLTLDDALEALGTP